MLLGSKKVQMCRYKKKGVHSSGTIPFGTVIFGTNSGNSDSLLFRHGGVQARENSPESGSKACNSVNHLA